MAPKETGGKVSMLLILAAIDLLSSALICGFLLFVTLVGADSSDADLAASDDGFGNGLSVVEVQTAKGSVQVLGQKADRIDTSLIATKFEGSFFGTAQMSSATYLIPKRIRALTLASLNGEVSVKIYAAGVAPIQFFFRCAPETDTILVMLDPPAFPPACKPLVSTTVLTLEKGATLVLANDQALAGLRNSERSSIRNSSSYRLSQDQVLPPDLSSWATLL